MRILIIDDNQEILELFETVLKATGQNTITVNNGRDGLHMILEQKFDLVFLDITMPEFSGLDVVKNLEAQTKLKESKIVFFTAASIPETTLQY